MSLTRVSSLLRAAFPLKVRALIMIIAWEALNYANQSVAPGFSVRAGWIFIANGLVLLVGATTARDAVDAVSMRLRGHFAAVPVRGFFTMMGLFFVVFGAMQVAELPGVIRL